MSNSSRGKRWTGWLTRKPSIVRPFPVLRCEELEDRRTPTQFTWTGLGGNANWSNPANWSTPSGPAAPTGLASESDDLVFPQLAGAPGQTTVTTVNDITGGVFNSISFSTTAPTAAYNLTGNALTLGVPGVTGSGFVTVNAGSGGSLVSQGAKGAVVFGATTLQNGFQLTNTLSMNITLGASAGSDQFFTIQGGGALNIAGQLKDSLGSSLTQEGTGLLGISGNNQAFTGTIKLDTIQGNGTVVVNNPNAIGGASSPGAIVGNNAGTGPTLEVNPDIGTVQTPIVAPVRLNGAGTNGAGALLNLGGTNLWAGPITLDHDAAIGASAGSAANPSVLNITGVIGDTGAGHNLSKEGSGEVQLNSPTGNTYRGSTTIDNGVLTVGTATGLGFNTTPPTFPDPRDGVIVNSTLTGTGQLRLLPLNGTGFTVVNKYLTLNDNGIGTAPSPNPLALADPGAFTNALGTNTWAGPVILGSPAPQVSSSVQIGAYPGTNLIISGPISSPNLPDPLVKVDSGMLVLNNANTYSGGTSITRGILDIRDSNALGTGGVGVSGGATLQLDVEAGLPPTAPGYAQRFADGQDPGAPPGPRDLWDDSATHDANSLRVPNALSILGVGVNGVGALYSETGINVWTGSITLSILGSRAAIGVAQDPRNGHPTPSSGYLADDYSLNVSGSIFGNLSTDFLKVGGGDLILSGANPYTSQTFVQQGWITVENNRSLGGDLPSTAAEAQPGTFVSPGAAVHILAPFGGSLTVPENIFLAGTGLTLPYEFLSQKGALVNLDGNNTWTGTIGLNGEAGIGVVETVPGSPTGSSLTVFGNIEDDRVSGSPITGSSGQPVYDDALTTTGGLVKLGFGLLTLQGAGTYSQSTDIVEGTVLAQSDTALGLSSTGTATTQQTYNQTPTTVQSGAVLELGQTVPTLNGGIQNGVQLTNEQLILNNPAQQIAVAGDTTPAPGTFTLSFNGATTVPIPTGASAAEVQAALNALPTIRQANIQTVQVLGTSGSGAFTLAVNGQTTPVLPVGATAAQVQVALDALSSVGGVGGSVTVSATPAAGGTVYTLVFGGTLANLHPPQLSQVVATAVPFVATITVPGSPTASQVQTVAEYLTDGAFTLTFNGQTTAPLAYNASAAAVQTALAGLSTVGAGNVGVTAAATPGGFLYTITFAGTLANTSLPLITPAALPVQAAITQAGTPAKPTIQAVQVFLTNASNTFQLSFNGASTGNLAVGASAAVVQAALNALPTISGLGGVTVTSAAGSPLGTKYTITFTGGLAQTTLPVSAAGTGNLPAVSSATVQVGLSGSVTVTEVPNPLGTQYSVTFGGDLGTGTVPVLGTGTTTATVSTVQPGSATQSAVQDISVNLLYGSFRLKFNGQTTAPVDPTQTPAQVAAQIQNVLAALPGVGTGNVSVVVKGSVYEVTFGGTLANTPLPQMIVVANGVELPGVTVTTPGGPATAEVQSILELASNATFTLSYKGQTTAALPITATALQVQNAINAALTNFVNDNSASPVTVTRNGNVFTVSLVAEASEIGLLTATPASAAPFVPELSVSGVTTVDGGASDASLVTQYTPVQNLTVTWAPGDTFTLSFNGKSTAPITYDPLLTAAQMQAALAGQIQAALNQLPTINGVGGFVTVYQTQSTAPVSTLGFTVTFGGTLANNTQPLMTSAAQTGTPTVTVATGPSAYDYAWRGPVTMNSGTRIATSENSRLNLLGVVNDATNEVIVNTVAQGNATQSAVQTVDVFGLGGAYTLSFNGATTIPLTVDTNVSHLAAAAAQIQDALNTLPTIGGVGGVVTVTPAAIPGGDEFTITFGGALAKTGVPQMISNSLAIGTAVVQPGGPGQAAVQTVSTFLPSGSFLLTFNNQTTAPIPYNATAAQVQAALTALTTIGGSGGTVVVTAATSTNGTVYTISFGGSLANTTVPQLIAAYNGSDLVKRGQGELLLAGNNSFRGTTWVDQGIVTAANSQAFGSTLNGTVVANNAQLQTQGSLTISGEPLTVQGTGVTTPSSLANQWFNVGPSPTNNSQSTKGLPTSGRIISVAADPSDPSIIYIATAGGGAWKTVDNGHHWTQLFDNVPDPGAVMWGSAIAVAPQDPNRIYFGTGDPYGLNNGSPITGQADNYAGTGVYMSTDAGKTWTLLISPNGGSDLNPLNPLYAQSVTQIIVDPSDEDRIWVGSSNIVTKAPGVAIPNQSAGTLQGSTTAVAGVWRFTPTEGWYDLTGQKATSPARQNVLSNPASGSGVGIPGQAPYDPPSFSGGKNNGGVGAPGTVGPDDDYRITFPGWNGTTPQFSWSSLALVNGVLYASLYMPADLLGPNAPPALPPGVPPPPGYPSGFGQQPYIPPAAKGTPPLQQAIRNAVYRSSDPVLDNPSWFIGDANLTPGDPQAKDPVSGFVYQAEDSRVNEYPVGASDLSGLGRNGMIKLTAVPQSVFPFSTIVYASNLQPDSNVGAAGQLLDIQKTTVTGTNWDSVGWAATGSAPVNPFGVNSSSSTALGLYDNAILAQDVAPNNNENVVYLAGENNIYVSLDGGTTWNPITPDASGNAPAFFFHGLALDIHDRLLSVSDGGIWQGTVPAGQNAANPLFTDLNGDLAITQLNSADPNPTDINQAIVGSQNNGIQQLGTSPTTPPAWTAVNTANGVNGGMVAYDPQNPLVEYTVLGGMLFESQNGGVSWNRLLNVAGFGSGASPLLNQIPVAVDPVDPNRIVVGGGVLQESKTGGTSFIPLNDPLSSVTAFGLGTYQGPFQPDPAFPQVTDQLSNTYTPQTIYATNGQNIVVTKNEGVTWDDRSNPVFESTYTITFGGSLGITDVPQLGFATQNGAHVIVATKLNGQAPSTNEVQTVTVTGNAGQFNLTFINPITGQSFTTIWLPVGPPGVGATAAQVAAALNALPNIGGTFTRSAVQDIIESSAGNRVSPPPPDNPTNPPANGRAFGAFTLTFAGQTTYPLPGGNFTDDDTANAPFNTAASDAEVRAALEALPAIGAGNVIVTHKYVAGAIDYQVQFVGALANKFEPLITAANVNPPNVGVIPPPPGGLSVLAGQISGGNMTVDTIDDYMTGGSFTVSFTNSSGVKDTTLPEPWNVSRANLEADLNKLNSIAGTNPASTVHVGIANAGVSAAFPQGIPGAVEFTITFNTGPLATGTQPLFSVTPNGGGASVTTQNNVIGGGASVGAGVVVNANASTVTSIAVDPSNRDIVYLTESYSHGEQGPVVYRSTQAGLPGTWVDITGSVSAPADVLMGGGNTWSSTVDPRTDTLYIGTDNGVWALAHASQATSGGTTPVIWSRVGAGMPAVKVTEVTLNQSLNTLTAASYGRSMFQLFLTDYADNTGAAVRALSGSTIWTGPVTLSGPTTIAADGNQNVQNGIAAASLNIIGTISDGTPGGNYTLTVGTSTGTTVNGSGTVILSGTNTYGGQTVVQDGILEVNNPNALGAATAGGNTVVKPGAQLALESDLEAEPVTINGDGIVVNGIPTGALRNAANNNTYTGTLTLGSDTVLAPNSPNPIDTIGVDSGTTLTIGVKPGLFGTGTVTDAGAGTPPTLHKESTGTLVLASANSYGGLTVVDEGALQVQNGNALGAAGANVLDGAQVQIARNAITLAPTVVPSTAGPLLLAGSGIVGTGALENVRGDANPTGSNDNVWAGPIVFTDGLANDPAPAGYPFPAYSPLTTPASQVTIGVGASGVPGVLDTLTLATNIQDSGLTPTSLGLIKAGPGRLTLAQANSYTGVTNVNAGSVRIQDPGSLGPTQASSAVQSILIVGAGNPLLNLTFEGTTVSAQLTGNAAADALAIQNALKTIPILNGNVAVSGATGQTSRVFTVTFGNALAATPVPQLSASGANLNVTVLTPQVGGTGVIVAPGAALELDGDPTYSGTSALTSVNKALTINGDGLAGTAIVTSAPVTGGTVYTVSLGGALGGSIQPAVTATGANGTTAVVTTPPVQAVQVAGDDGTFILTFKGQSTGQIPFDATAAQVQAALNGLSTVGNGGTGYVSVTLAGDPTLAGGATYLVTFGGSLAGSPQPQITAASVTAYTGVVLPGSPTASEQQSVTVLGTSGTYTLTYQGATTGQIPATATGAQLAAALNALPTIGGVGGTVTVTPTGPGSVFTVTFGGSLAFTSLPLLTVGSSTATTSTIQAGGGTAGTQAVTVTGTSGTFTLSFAGQKTAPLPFNATAAQVQAALAALTGIGGPVGPRGNQEGLGALNNVSGSNTFAGPVTLGAQANPNLAPGQAGASIGAAPGTTLTVAGVQDPTPLVAPAPQLQKVGLGTVVFPNQNTYGGLTNVVSGVLRISNQFALGTSQQDIQTVTVTSPSFTLTFNGQTTAALPQNATAADVQAALHALLTSAASTASNYNGNLDVVVTRDSTFVGGARFSIAFVPGANGPATSLANTNLPAITATGVGSPGTSFTTVVQSGNGPETQKLEVLATNGTFTLTFNGLNGVAQSTTPLVFNATAAQVQAALAALPNIGAGNVVVTATPIPGGIDYTVTFVGALANYNVPQLQASVTGGTQVVVTTLNDGPGGTTVEAGATLQISPVPTGGSLAMSPEVVTINGQGFNNQGALNVNGGTVLWNNNPLILGSNASIGTTSTLNNDALTFNTPITDQGNGFNLDVYGPGVVTFQETGNNQYTGTTTVHGGTLALAATGGTTAGGAVMGPLVVGDGTGQAIVREQLSNQVADTSSVTVNQGGLFDLNQKTDTIKSLSVVNGTVETGSSSNTGGHLTVATTVAMSGGTIDVGAGGSLASGDVTMSAGAQIVAFDNSTVTAGAVAMTGSSILLGNGVALSAASLNLTGSTIGLAAGATGGDTVSTTGAVSLSNLLTTPSSISLGNSSTLTVGSSTPAALTLTGTSAAPSSVTLGTGSKLTTGSESVTASAIVLGNNDVWTAGTVALDDGTFTTGTGLSATTGDVTLANGSAATIGGGGTVASGTLTLTGGSLLSVGAGTSDTDQSANLTGSTIDIGAGATVTLFGNLTATSSATAPAGVTGTGGTLDFHGANPAVNVTPGPRPEPVDLLISAILSIAGSGANQLLKTGLGLLELDPTVAFPDLLNVQAGNVQVDTVAGNVALNGGTLSGSGSVGTIDNGATINPPGAIGTVSPGESYGAVTAITTPGTATTSEVQTLWHFTATGPFTLTFQGQTTSPLAATATAADVQAALVGLSTIGAGNVTVTATPIPGGTLYTITFGGSLANSPQPQITAAPIAGAGILTSTPTGKDLLGAGSTFSVYLSNASGTHPNPVAGADYSQLAVNGTIDLTGATLDVGSLVGPGIENGDTFTIITATEVDGTFANGPGVFISGQKFQIVYTPTSVVLQKALASATITSLVSSLQTAEVNEPVTITATVTPEAGAGAIPAADTVTFTLTPQSGPTITVTKTKDPATGRWVLNTQTDIAGGLPPGTYAVSAVFNGDASNFTPSAPVSLASNLVVLQPSIDSLTAAATNVASFGQPGYISPNNSPAVQDTTALSTTVHQELSATGYTVKVYNNPALTGTPVRTFTGTGALSGTDVTISTAWDGKDDSSAFVADGTYYVTTTFTDPWGNTLTSGPVTVKVDNTSPAATTLTTSAQVIAPSVASSVPTTVTLTGTVGDSNLSGWTLNVYSQADNSLVFTTPGTGTAVNVTWDGRYDSPAFPSRTGQIVPDGQYNASVTATDLAGNATTSTPASVFVFSSPTVQVSSNSPTVGFGQSVTFTATVSVPTQLAGFVTGTNVSFFTDGTSRGDQPLTQTGTIGGYTTFQATLTIPVLNAGTYQVTAVYPGNNNVTPGTSPPITQMVTPAPLTVAAQDESSVYGAPLPGLTNAYSVTGLLDVDPTGGFTGALSVQGSASQPYPVGTYAIGRGTLTPDGNYTIQTFTGATLTVTPAPLTITVDDATKQVGAPLPTFTFTAHGLVGGDTSAVVTGLTLKTTATQSSPAGTYPITAVGTPTAGANYTVVGVTPGVLTVSPQLTNLAVGSGGGGPATVNIYSPTGKLLNSFTPFPGFTGEVRTASGDFNGDGVQDIAVATGPGVQAEVKVFDGATGVLLFDDLPFDTFTGGAFVSAGNLSGNGVADLAISPDQGGGPRVTVLAGGTFQPIVDFFGINDPNFRGGARTTFADVNHDGFADLVVAAGFGGGPRVSIWDGKSLNSLHYVNVVPDFFAFEPALRNGVYVAGGDVNGDGYADLVLGAGPGGGPRVMVVDGQKLVTQGPLVAVNKPMANFFAGNTANRSGVRVAAKTLAGSLDTDVVTGDASGELVTAYKGSTLASGQQSVLFSLDAFPELNSGVYVG